MLSPARVDPVEHRVESVRADVLGGQGVAPLGGALQVRHLAGALLELIEDLCTADGVDLEMDVGGHDSILGFTGSRLG